MTRPHLIAGALDRLRAVIRRCARNRDGIAAVEFATMLPLMILLYFGSVEVSQAIAIKNLVTLCASTVANLVTQYPTISGTQTMPDILNAASSVLNPWPSSSALVRVSAINIDANGNATVAWSKALNGSGLNPGSPITVPASLATPNTQLIYGETTYSFTPALDYISFGTFSLASSVYMFPRSPTGVVVLTP